MRTLGIQEAPQKAANVLGRLTTDEPLNITRKASALLGLRSNESKNDLYPSLSESSDDSKVGSMGGVNLADQEQQHLEEQKRQKRLKKKKKKEAKRRKKKKKKKMKQKKKAAKKRKKDSSDDATSSSGSSSSVSSSSESETDDTSARRRHKSKSKRNVSKKVNVHLARVESKFKMKPSPQRLTWKEKMELRTKADEGDDE